MKKILLTPILIILLVTHYYFALDKWKAIESDNFLLYYPSEKQELAVETLSLFEHYRPFIKEYSGHDLDKLPIILENVGFNANGYANPLEKKIGLYTGSFSPSSPFQTKNWLGVLTVHEMMHIAHLNYITGKQDQTRSIFGNFYYPNIYSPIWVTEGLAVNAESSISKYDGRLNDGKYNAYFQNQLYQNSTLNLEDLFDTNYAYPLNKSYLYGGLFFEYLIEEYGKDSVAEFIDQQSIQTWYILTFVFPNLSIDKAAKQVFGKSFNTLYSDYLRKEKEKRNWVIDGNRETRTGWYKDFLLSGENHLFYTQFSLDPSTPYNPKENYTLIGYNPNTKKERIFLKDTTGIASPLQLVENHLYYLKNEIRKNALNISNNHYGFTRTLHKLNTRTKKEHLLLKDDISAFVVMENSDIYYSHYTPMSFKSTLKQYSNSGSINIAEIDYEIGEMIAYGKDIIFVGRKRYQSWNLYSYNIANNIITPILELNETISNISIHENEIIYTLNKDKQYGTYAYNLQTKTSYKLNSSSYSASGVIFDNNLYFISFSRYGEDLYKETINRKNLSLKRENVAPPIGITSYKDVSVTEKNSKSLLPFNRIPYVLGQDNLNYFNYSLTFNDKSEVVLQSNFNFFRPLVFGIRLEGSTTYITAKKSLYKSNQKGLQELNVGLFTDLNDEHLPYITSFLNYDWVNIDSLIRIELDKKGYQITNKVELPLNVITLDFSYTFHDNFDKYYQTLRGLTYAYHGALSGTSYSANLTHLLLQVNQGHWSPNIAFGNVFGRAFYDYASFFPEENAIGYEVLAELNLFKIPITPSFGISVIDSDIKKFFKLQIPFSLIN